MHRTRFFPLSLVVASFLLCINAANTRAQSFVYNRAAFATGAQPVGVAMADFNSDGRLDLAVANSNDTSISILLGKPDGTMSPKVDLQSARGPQQIIAADFNGDGKMDLAITYYYSSTGSGLQVFLGNGDGTFAAPVQYTVGPQPNGLAAADLNHDGKLDLIVADSGVSVLLGNGDGTFKPATTALIPQGAIALTVADFNQDGDPDIAVMLVIDTGIIPPPNYTGILLGNGDGTFQEGEVYRTGNSASSIVAADFNGDRIPDLLITSVNNNQLLVGNGDGTFQAPTAMQEGVINSASMALAADFNHDGKMDFAVAGYGKAYVFLGNGDGTFQYPTDTYAGNFQSQIAVGDVNGDGSLDIAQTDYSDNQVAILLGNGDGTFGPVMPLPAMPYYQTAFPFSIGVQSGLIADFTGDGKPDLALAAGDQGYQQGGLVVFPGQGDGTLGTPVISNFYAQVLAKADFNEDGKMDMVFTNGDGAGMALGNGDGSFGSVTQLQTFFGWPARQVVSGDFNNDGHQDVVVMANGFFVNPSLSVYLGNGNGTFRALTPFGNGSQIPTSLSAADINRDGKLDLFVTYGSSFTVMLGNGDGTFQAPVSYASAGFPGAVGDLNGDGKPDILTTDSVRVDVYLGNGTSAFGAPQTYDAGSYAESLTTGDFNGDGKLDVTVLHDFGVVSILYGNGDGTLQPPILVDVPYALGPLSVGDFNQDGLEDILVGGGTGSLIVPRPIVSFFPAAVHFGTQIQGTTSAAKTITLTNVGLIPVKISQISASADFAASSQCGATLQKGATCTIGVTFAPSGPGVETGTLLVQDNTPSGAHVIPLTVVGTGSSGQVPAAGLAPSALTFSGQTVGTSSSAQTVTLSNSGNAVLTIDSIATTGDFSETHNCGLTLNASASCAIHVVFAPTQGRRRAGTLTVTDNSVNSPQVVALSGLGVSGHVSLGSSTVDFGAQLTGTTSVAKTVTIANTGPVPLTFTNIAVNGSFSLAAGGTTCSTSSPLAGNASCVIQMTFSPPSSGSFTGTLILTDNDDGVAGSTQSVVLTGTGTNSSVSLSTTELSFPVQLVGTSSPASSMTVSNTSSSPLSISGITATGDFTQTNTCGSSIAVGSNCTISVTFSPSVTGRIFGSLVITDGAANSPQNVTLDGDGVDFALSVSGGSTKTVVAGSTATYTIGVGEQGTSTALTVNLTCSGAPAETLCSISPNPLLADSSTGTTVTVTTQLATQGAPRSTPRNHPSPPTRGIKELIFLAIALTLVVWAIALKRRNGLQRWGRSLLPLVAGIALLFVLSGCGGGGGGGGGGPVHDPGTPTGTYTLTITGTVGSGASAISRSVTLKLNVS